MKLFAEICKVDAEKRMVYGYASTEAMDSQGERISIDALKDALPDYMKFANIREMHGPSAAGVAKEATIDDKGLYLGVKVVDDQAWEKVKEAVYKGFSIGGKMLEKIGDTITALKLTEISLVDRPANPEALIEMWKADMTTQTQDANAIDELANLIDSGVNVADLVKFARENLAKSADDDCDCEDEDDCDCDDIEDAEKAAKAAKSDDDGDDDAEKAAGVGDVVKAEGTTIEKGLSQINVAADILGRINDLFNWTAYESQAEGDASPIPAKLKEAAASFVDILKAIVDEETAELLAAQGTTGAVIALADGSKDDIAKADAGVDLAKAIETAVEKAVGVIKAENVELAKRVKQLEAMPQAPKAAVRAITKGDDVAASAAKEVEPIRKSDGSVNDVATEIKKAFAAGPVKIFR